MHVDQQRSYLVWVVRALETVIHHLYNSVKCIYSQFNPLVLHVAYLLHELLGATNSKQMFVLCFFPVLNVCYIAKFFLDIQI